MSKEPTGNITTLSGNKSIRNLFQNLDTTPEIVKKEQLEWNVNKSCGPNGINAHFLKSLANELCELLSMIMDFLLNIVNWQKKGKQANEWATLKKGDSKDPGDHRPVSLTSIVGKNMERAIWDHITDHTIKNIF